MKYQSNHWRFRLFLILIIIASGLNARPNRPETTTVSTVENVGRFITGNPEISASDVLDAERLVDDGKLAEAIGDTLQMEIRLLTDTTRVEPFDSTRLLDLTHKGLRILGTDLEYTPDVRRIQRSFSAAVLKEFEFTKNSLLQYALKQYFQAKKKNPFEPKVKIDLFQLVYAKMVEYQAEELEFHRFLEWCHETKWLPGERRGYYVLAGNFYQFFEDWDSALTAYDSAYQLVKHTLYPPGIDSSFAAYHDSVASKAFIPKERQLMAEVLISQAFSVKVIHDSLLLYYNFFNDSSNYEIFTDADSQVVRDYLEKAIPLIKPVERASINKHRQLVLRQYNFRLSDVRYAIDELFRIVEEKMLSAKEIDPFNQFLRLQLAQQVYYNTAAMSLDSSLYMKAVQEFENLLYSQKGHYATYMYAGNAYMGVKRWEDALKSYETAELVYRKNAIFSFPEPELYFSKLDSVPLDTNFLAYNYYHQAMARIKLYDGDNALKLLRLAHQMTKNSKEVYQNQITLLSWDDGNVHAMNLKAVAYRYHRQGNLNAARDVYIRLLGILKTQRTKDEINSQIAFLDFTELGRQDEGIERMRTVVTPMERDSTDAALSAVNQKYFDYYGRMCYEMGRNYQSKENRKLAYIYYSQSTRINWPGRATAYLALANLSQFDPRETIKLCKIALNESEKLQPDEKRQAAQMLSNAFRKDAKFKEARIWHQKSLDRDWCENREDSEES